MYSGPFNRTVSRELCISDYFDESSSLRPMIISQTSIPIFLSKIHKNFRNSRCTTLLNNTGGELTTVVVFENIEIALTEYLGAWRKTICDKNLTSQILWQCPFKEPECSRHVPLLKKSDTRTPRIKSSFPEWFDSAWQPWEPLTSGNCGY
jgi:hypothetical protein